MGNDPLERLLFTPTPAQRRIMGLGKRLGKAMTLAEKHMSAAQSERRASENKDRRIRELEADLLEKRAEAAGFRLAAFELLDPAAFRAIDDRCKRTREEDGVLPAGARLTQPFPATTQKPQRRGRAMSGPAAGRANRMADLREKQTEHVAAIRSHLTDAENTQVSDKTIWQRAVEFGPMTPEGHAEGVRNALAAADEYADALAAELGLTQPDPQPEQCDGSGEGRG